MTYFEWNSQVELAHPQINEHHKRLFALSEAVAQSLADSPARRPAAPALQALIEFAREHFQFEETLMRASAYAGADTHAHYHALLLAELEDYFRRMQAEGNTNLTVTGLVAYLWRWLILHIDSADRELVRWLQTHQPQKDL
jgi:hemerythrin